MYNFLMSQLSGSTKSTDRSHPELVSVLCASLNTLDLSPKLRSANPTVSYSKVLSRKGMNSPTARTNSTEQRVLLACFFLMAVRNIDALGSSPMIRLWEFIDLDTAQVTSPVPHARSKMRLDLG